MTDVHRKPSILDRVVLNAVQKEAIACDQWPQLVFAGAGSGKTRVLTAKIAYLIEHERVFPGNIFAATFTNKAAREMRERIEGLIGASCDGLWMGTFHSLCARILRREARFLGFSPAFTIYDTDDSLSQIKHVMKALELDERTIPPRRLLKSISDFKNNCTRPQDLDAAGVPFYQREIVRAYEMYQKHLQQQNAMDFDDLLTNTVVLFRSNPEVLQRYRDQFKYILVDEYQDTNTSQFQLIKALGQQHGRLFVVGDDDQSIYGWRGARIENILSFEKNFESAKVFKLEQNYRSTPQILDFANAAISCNVNRAQKKLWTACPKGDNVKLTAYVDDRQEAEGVADAITGLQRKGVKLGSMAILYRTNAQSRVFEDALRKRKLPYILVGGISFYERKEIKDCIAYLRLLVNPKDNVACDRILNVPARGLGPKAREMLVGLAREQRRSMLEVILSEDASQLGVRGQKGFEDLRTIFSLLIDLKNTNTSAANLLSEMLTVTGYLDALQAEESEEANDRVENINELVNTVAAWSKDNPGKPLELFLEEVSLVADIDSWKEADDAVNCMTLHCAKGLEFEVVFLVGLEDGLLPSRQNFDDAYLLEEECRLLYVGVTRAMKTLECSYAHQRWRFGSIMPMEQSRFLRSVDPNHYHFVDRSEVFEAPPRVVYAAPSARPGRTVRPGRPEPAAPPPTFPDYENQSQDAVQYRMGQHVMHKQYGPGKILSVSGFGPDLRLTILFNNGIRKKLMGRFANLEAITDD
jgi:DNA helicase-2/ATP-dependent DNA helicase PcrA